ncbi:MAG: hypothetical protein A2X56_02255 [Nitrospirae bacterium GWC2_57_13]|jgi:hypothetical protein|nr:MAG: hypothetical protein A2X56_02255 [Nitrospirae bacterium GWC2_57_13]OGW43260.1 MAG: hypothetical protein A2X57_08430 [Nitrospirae bacterium GWD2_57_8]
MRSVLIKKEWAFIALMTVGGLFVGFSIASFFIYVINPGLPDHLLTLSEKLDADLMSARVGWLTENITPLIACSAVLVVLGFILLLINLNDRISIALFKDKTRALKFLAMVAVEAVLFYLLFALTIIEPMDNLLKLYGSGKIATGILLIKFAAFFLVGGLAWLVAGEAGWAGDFSSWKMRLAGRAKELTTMFLLGGIAGLSGGFLYVMNDWIFRKYYVLVSEVLDRSSEVSLAGINLITYELMLMTSLSMGILAGLAVALSPAQRDTRIRLSRLTFPGALLLIAVMIVLPAYLHAVVKYDLGKKNLAEAVGIQGTTAPSKTVLFTGPGEKAVVQKWNFRAAYYSTSATHSIAVTYQNLEKVRQYLDQRENRSIFQYDAEEALYRGYATLWDTERALERQFVGAQRMLSLRMILLSRMPSLPVTSKNLSYLRSFTDESNWYAGRDAALQMAEAFIHFGRFKEARMWLGKARARGAKRSEVARIKIPSAPVLRSGVIRGRITVNGTPLAGARVALFTDGFDKKELPHWAAAKRMLDARTLGPAGTFTFRYLGEGEYSLAIMTDSKTVPFDVSPKRITISGLPRLIRISKMAPTADLGTVDIHFSR